MGSGDEPLGLLGLELSGGVVDRRLECSPVEVGGAGRHTVLGQGGGPCAFSGVDGTVPCVEVCACGGRSIVIRLRVRRTCQTFVRPLISRAEVQGTVLVWTCIGHEGATTFRCGAAASPESVADAADSLDAVGDGAQFPAEAANHDVDGVAATVVIGAPDLAE